MNKGIGKINRHKSSSGKIGRGFTLVELIVVLAIIAILAASGTVAALGFINRSKFDQNSQNAITVYQTAQVAIAQKIQNGTIEDWIIEVAGPNAGFEDSELDSLVNSNDSIHHLIELTYNPGSEDNKLYSLLSSYFYDRSVFAGTISVVFDLSATKHEEGYAYYANVYGAFCSNQNKAGEGWDPYYIHSIKDYDSGNSDSAPWDKLPWRDNDFRRNNSFVGYYDGSTSSLISPVMFPGQENANEYLFTLRNGETLDISWSVFGDTNHDADLTFDIYDLNGTDDEPILTLNVNETKLLCDNAGNLHELEFEDGELLPKTSDYLRDAGTVKEYIEVTDSYFDSLSAPINGIKGITRTSVEGLAVVDVTANGSTQQYIFPLTITSVEGDRRSEMPLDGYTTYTISIDCMMTRSDYESFYNTDYSSKELYTSTRLFGTVPKNIYVTAEGSAQGVSIPKGTKFTRAINDPVFFKGVNEIDSEAKYCYDSGYGLGAQYDDYGLSGCGCVVNTLYGDLKYDDNIGGTDISDKKGSAVITSYRHLSNLRYNNPKNEANWGITFRIVRDLNWYYNIKGSYTSEVKVFSRNSVGTASPYNSPASNNNLRIVSFPALQFLGVGNTLTSMSHPDPENGEMVTYAINNVQLRANSFKNYRHSNKSKYDAWGVGLIGENRGKIFNIYINNMNFTLKEVTDGELSDYSNFSSPNGPINITPSSENPLGLDNNSAVGGLVGINIGSLGDDSVSDESLNTICLTNCIISSGDYWHYSSTGNVNNASGVGGVGGVVGRNVKENNYTPVTSGLIEMRGSFAVVGKQDVGGILGFSSADIGARLVVDGNPVEGVDPEIILPSNIHMISEDNMSCMVAGRYRVGGAVGRLLNATFTYETGDDYSVNVDDKNKIAFTDPSSYQLSVTLPENALVLCTDQYENNAGVGGAIGNMEDRVTYGTGDDISILISNEGEIISQPNAYLTRVGGAVGFISNYKANSLYINAYNGGRLFVNSLGNKECYCGGAIGQINYRDKDLNASQFDNIGINITNEGDVLVNSTIAHSYAGGAVGRFDGCRINTALYVKVNNRNNTVIGSAEGSADRVSVASAAIAYAKKAWGDNANIYIDVNNEKEVTVRASSTVEWEFVAGAVCCIENTQIRSMNISVDNKGKLILYAPQNPKNNFAGGAVARITGGNIQNTNIIVTNSNLIELLTSNNESYCGGAIGRNDSRLNGKVSVLLTNDGNISGYNYTGGAIGRNDKQIDGDISVSLNGSISGNNDTGGVIGNNSGLINGIITATLTGNTISGINNTGGVIGYNNKEINRDITLVASESSKIDGNDSVGGVIGNNNSSVNGTISATLTDNTISGNNNTGGVIGYNNKEINRDITLVASESSEIDGNDSVGGVIGKNNSSVNGTISASLTENFISGHNNIGGVIGNNSGLINGIITATLTGNTISGNNNIGGVIGYNNNQINRDISLSFNGSVSGNNNIGGVIGYNNYQVNINLTLVASEPSRIEGKDSSVGGVIGYNNSSVNGNISVTLTGNVISGNSNTGGAIGYNNSQINRDISVSLSGSIKGGNNTAGVIGYNNNQINSSVTLIDSKEVNINGNDSVGGVIGYNNGVINNTVPMTISGMVSGVNNVGGYIGYNKGVVNNLLEATIKGTIQGNNNIGGVIGLNENALSTVNVVINEVGKVTVNPTTSTADALGGAIGYNAHNVSTINANIAGVVGASGATSVGGAIGFAGGSKADRGNITNSLNVTLSGESRIEGVSCLGGAIGKVGDRANGSYPRIATINLTVNQGRYIYQTSEPSNGYAYIGGVIGKISDADVISAIRVMGSGGSVDLSAANINIPSSPNSNSNSVLITGVGKSIGGIIGQICEEPGSYNPGTHIEAIDVSSSPSFYVVSGGASDGVGGWVGAGYGRFGGFSSSTYTSYTVSNVAMVYSDGDDVGMFCGCINTLVNNNTRGNLYPNISVNRNGVVHGADSVGGVIGRLDNTGSGNTGSVNITIPTSGLTITGQNNVGGVIGSVYNCTIDKSLGGENQADQADGLNISGYDDVGGLIGKLENSYINRGVNVAFTTLNISGNNNVGGVIGRFENSTINSGANETFTESNISGNNNVGGVIGDCVSGTLNGTVECAINNTGITGVSGVGGAMGLFVNGRIANGFVININDSYIGDSSASNHCINAGGAIGRMEGCNLDPSASISVNLGENCMVYAGGNSEISDITAGVGGAVGVFGTEGGGLNPVLGNDKETVIHTYFTVECPYSYASVRSASAPVGGAVGRMLSGSIFRSFSTAVVKGNDYVGGFIGYMHAGKVDHSYVGGHTIQGGTYDPNEMNIAGNNYVGGFIGYVDASVNLVKMCYSTASVSGYDYVGGLVGYDGVTSDNIYNATYCTGLVVISPDSSASHVGAYAGYIENVDAYSSINSGNKVLGGINVDSTTGAEVYRIVGAFGQGQTGITSDKLNFAPYTDIEYGPQYIRADNPDCVYTGFPYDPGLPTAQNGYPYRTYISALIPNSNPQVFHGEHHGDWPVLSDGSGLEDINNADVMISSDSDTRVYRDGDDFAAHIPFRYGLGDQGVIIPGTFSVKYKGTILSSDAYIIRYEENTHVTQPGGPRARVIITGERRAGYIGAVTIYFYIDPVDLSTSQIELTVNDQPADGFVCNGNNMPKVTVTYIDPDNGNRTTVVDDQYDVTYANNTSAGTAQVIVTARQGSNCTGSVTKDFTIRNPRVEICDLYNEDGSSAENVTLLVEYDKKLSEAGYVEPSRPGYSFAGLKDNPESDKYYDMNSTVKNDLTLYACWEALPATAPGIGSNGSVTLIPNTGELEVTVDNAAVLTDNHELSYQWYENETNDNESGHSIEGATESTYKVPNLEEGTRYYYCVVTATRKDNGESEEAVSKTVEILAAVVPEVTVERNEENNTVTLVANTPEGHELSYQWYQSNNSDYLDGVAIDKATSESIEIKADDTNFYYCVVTATRTDNGQSASTIQKIDIINKDDENADDQQPEVDP